MLSASALSSRRQAFTELKAGMEARHRETFIARFTQDDPSVIRSGFSEFDRSLGGGFARGTIATLEGPASSGRTAIAARLLAVATRSGLAAAVDDGTLFPPALAQAGVRLERLLVMPAADATGIARAADILLRSQAFGTVLMPAVMLKAAVWTRLAGLAHRANSLLLALGCQASSELGYFASARVRCAIARVLWTHASGPFCELAGYDIRTDVIKNKRAAPAACSSIRIIAKGTERLRERSLGFTHKKSSLRH
ncbi:MAG: hypothetical protein NVS9B12_10960 [Vulcanimicrobiaceae bacterium]